MKHHGLDNTSIIAEAKYFINSTKSRRKTCLCLHYSADNSCLYDNGMKIHQFKTKDSEIKPYPFHAGNISKGFIFDNVIKTRLKGKVYNFFISHKTAHISDTEDIHKHLVKKHNNV